MKKLPSGKIPALANIGIAPFLLGSFLFWIAVRGRAGTYWQIVSGVVPAGNNPAVEPSSVPNGAGAGGGSPYPPAPVEPGSPMLPNPGSQALQRQLDNMGLFGIGGITLH